jgi:hypothetical protein
LVGRAGRLIDLGTLGFYRFESYSVSAGIYLPSGTKITSLPSGLGCGFLWAFGFRTRTGLCLKALLTLPAGHYGKNHLQGRGFLR